MAKHQHHENAPMRTAQHDLEACCGTDHGAVARAVTLVSGLAAAARRGILIKGGTYLEDARLIKAMAVDKT